MTTPFGFDDLKSILHRRIAQLPDHRTTGPNTRRSYWIPGSYETSSSMSAGSNALPRLRTLCTNSKNPR